MSLIVKICGLSTPESLDVALDAGADMVGFVFFPPSPRNISFDAARALGERVRGRAQKVALSVDAGDALLDAVVESLQPDLLQLHGKESPARVAALKKRYGLPVMKAIAVEVKGRPRPPSPTMRRSPIACCSMRARRAKRRGRAASAGRSTGGSWKMLDPGVPFMLSGGLDAGNLGEALRITHAPGVDVSSGVERAPGEKDPDKICAFVRAAREAAARA